jgi:hypothetical protein
MTNQPFSGHIYYIEPKQPPTGYSWWIGQPRDGFTLFASLFLAVPIPVEDVTAGEARVIQQRHDVLVKLNGTKAA